MCRVVYTCVYVCVHVCYARVHLCTHVYGMYVYVHVYACAYACYPQHTPATWGLAAPGCAGSCAPVLPCPPGSSQKLQQGGHSCCACPVERGALRCAGSLDQSAAPQPSPSLVSP